MSIINATPMNLFNVITRLTQVMNKWHSQTKTMQTMKNSIHGGQKGVISYKNVGKKKKINRNMLHYQTMMNINIKNV
jgi:hypothetical protein